MYRELLFTGKLAEHCERMKAEAFKLSEKLQESYIAKNPLPEDDFWMRVSIWVMAQMVAYEVVSAEIVLHRQKKKLKSKLLIAGARQVK